MILLEYQLALLGYRLTVSSHRSVGIFQLGKCKILSKACIQTNHSQAGALNLLIFCLILRKCNLCAHCIMQNYVISQHHRVDKSFCLLPLDNNFTQTLECFLSVGYRNLNQTDLCLTILFKNKIIWTLLTQLWKDALRFINS